MVFFNACKEKKTEEAVTEKLPKEKSLPTQPFSEFLEAYENQRLDFYPLEATQLGKSEYNNKLPIDISRDFRVKLAGFYRSVLNKLNKYPKKQLADSEQTSFEVLKWECEIKLEELKFKTHLIPINQFSCLPLTMGQLASGKGTQPFKNVKDYDNWTKRLKAYTVWIDTAIANMNRGISQGYVLPKALAVKVLPQLEEMANTPFDQHLFYSPINNFPNSMGRADRGYQEMSFKMVLSRDLIPAFTRLRDFFKTVYLPACRTEIGVTNNPDGMAYYNHQIKKFTTTSLTADEIYEIGQQEVIKLLAEMEKVKAQVNYKGSLLSFFDHVRNRKQLMPFTKPEQVIAHFNAIHEKMQPQLAMLFDKTPKTSFEVRQTEAFREKTASAEYNPGTPDGKRPGVFYVPLPDVSKYNTFADEDLFLHEAIPGHHFQISLQQEDSTLPEFRKPLWYSAYGEGWALYCESLGEELGLYTDPYQYFGMLSAEMHRAIRLVVDVGMHVKGMTREEAIAFSLENEAEPEESVIAEIERYISWPGQALSYKIGQLKIIELRNKAQESLGEQFDIKEFHNVVLGTGCVPLAVLEQVVNEWMAEKKTM